jgi:DNA-binding NarL/FixJ family response regulator
MKECTPTGPSGTRIVVADREPSLRRALGALAAQCLGMEVAGEAGTAATLRHQIRLLKPKLAIVGWSLIDDADSLPAAMRSSSRGLRIVALGIRPDVRAVALSAGADAFVSVADAPHVVARVLRSCQGSTEPAAGESSGPGGPQDDRDEHPGTARSVETQVSNRQMRGQ